MDVLLLLLFFVLEMSRLIFVQSYWPFVEYFVPAPHYWPTFHSTWPRCRAASQIVLVDYILTYTQDMTCKKYLYDFDQTHTCVFKIIIIMIITKKIVGSKRKKWRCRSVIVFICAYSFILNQYFARRQVSEQHIVPSGHHPYMWWVLVSVYLFIFWCCCIA